MRAKDVLGRRGEELASGYLEAQGMRILDRNWRCPEGEIDIVAVDGGTLVFAEVKTRTSLAYGHPFEAVGADKLARLHRLAAAWCRHHGLLQPPRRVDVVAVLDDGSGEPAVEHLKGVA
ncbi:MULTISPECIES: YraN family protein [unclassified Arthrobacter]|uniref:YraN family protein n=1 Tax=unclassified Arthrobacter TaxID=235627 RepID=UPI002DFD076C|nr:MULTISPECIES: YraN family protein [unclassified Arthrobacter]MEC5191039.1 putative endonuclease [Arthrobacter sp. MP_M4]MEC5202210.1 putative endonuclease [Arthrobacter sp. MP_M7]